MLKCEINCVPGVKKVLVNGALEEVVFDLCDTINAIYTQVKRTNEKAGLAFKRTIMVTFGEADSPVWNGEAPGEGIVIVMPNEKKKGDA